MKADFQTWQDNIHALSKLSADDAKEMLSFLEELDASVRGSIRSCRNRMLALKDMEISRLRAELEAAKP